MIAETITVRDGKRETKVYRRTFEDSDDWMRHVMASPEKYTAGWRTGEEAASRRIETSFVKETWEQCAELIDRGWRKQSKDIARLLERIETKLHTLVMAKWTNRYDVRGATPNVPRLIAGHPRNMKRRWRQQRDTRNRPVRLLVNNCFSCDVREDSIKRRGLVIAALVNALRRSGRPVEVWTVFSVGSSPRGMSGSTLEYLIPVATAGQPMDVARVQYISGHPASLRRHMFAAMEQEDASLQSLFDVGGGYGYPVTTSKDLREEFSDVYFDSSYNAPDLKDPDAVIKSLTKELEVLGVSIEQRA